VNLFGFCGCRCGVKRFLSVFVWGVSGGRWENGGRLADNEREGEQQQEQTRGEGRRGKEEEGKS